MYLTAKHAQHGALLCSSALEESIVIADYIGHPTMHHQQVTLTVLLLALLAPGHAAAPASGNGGLSSSQRAADASASTDAEREAPLKQQIQFNGSDAPILLISADVPADCSCRLGVRDLQNGSALPAAEVAWTQLLATNVIFEIANVTEYVLDVDCNNGSEALQRCRAEPDQLHILNTAGSIAGSDGAVRAAGNGVIEAAIQVLAVPVTNDAADSSDSSYSGMQTSTAAVMACSSRSTAKWAARATLILVTTGLTFAADS